MEKRLIILITSILFSNINFAQSDSVGKSHAVYISFENWLYRDCHTVYGYQFSSGKHQFYFGFAIERKRLTHTYYNNNYYNYSYNYASVKDSNFSVNLNAVSFSYAYIFHPEKRLTAYPFIKMIYNRYVQEDDNQIRINPGIYVDDHFKIIHNSYIGFLGMGFKFDWNNWFTSNMEFGLGMGWVTEELNSNNFGNRYYGEVWAYYIAKLGVSYRFK